MFVNHLSCSTPKKQNVYSSTVNVLFKYVKGVN